MRIDHARTRSCASRSRSVTDTRLPSRRRPFWPSLTTPKHLTVSGGNNCLSEQLTKASRLHTHSGCATSSPTEKPKCRSTETEADSYHFARDSLKDQSCRRSSSCYTSTTFGESYPNTWRWPCLTTKSLKQPYKKTITNVSEWSRRRKLTLNPSKCEVAFLTNNSKEARCQPSLQLDGSTLNTISLPKFLGDTIDRTLSFGPHVDTVVSKASNRCRAFASLTSKRWGWRKDQLPNVYWALYLSVMNYAVPALLPELRKQ